MTRRVYVHQEELRVFLVLYCANVLKYVKNYNLRMLLDLIVKFVVDYTDFRLITRDFVAGKKCECYKGKYQKFGMIREVLCTSRDDNTIPYGADYESRVRKTVNFPLYESTMCQYHTFKWYPDLYDFHVQ